MLPGNSKSNQAWIETVEGKVKDVFEETRIIYYDHWQSGREMIDFETERGKLAKLVEDWSDYLVFAKSVGTLLTLAGTEDGVLRPKAALLCGFPWGFADQIGYGTVDSAWKMVNYPVILLQNEADPAGGYDRISEYLAKIKPEVSVVKTKGTTHDYLDYDLIREKLMALKSGGL